MFLSISIHALREEGDEDAHGNYMTEQISIHALREEGDPVIPLKLCGLVEISIHALREEGDEDAHGNYMTEQISIHALREEGDTRAAARAEAKAISIHAQLKKRQTIREFLSTPSSRRATD